MLYVGIKRGSDEQKRFTAEEIINKLHEAEVLQSKGQSLAEVVRQLGVSNATYYEWRKDYGRSSADQSDGSRNLKQRINV